MKIKALISILTILSLSSCSEINTTNPTETYKYWSGTNSPSNLELLNGQYWQSSHWTKPIDAPTWFKPSGNSVRFGGNSDFDQGARYFKDTLTGVCFIYEIQL